MIGRFIDWLTGAGKKKKFTDLLANGAQVIDVRTRQEFASGHFSHSRNIPLSELAAKASEISKKGKPVILCCASGIRAAQGLAILKKQGIEVYNAGSWAFLDKL
jgi:rhodanese-related sulfurtransferase